MNPSVPIGRSGSARRRAVARRAMARRAVIMAAPPAVVLSMLAVFRILRDRYDAVTAYNRGFAVYWTGWCLAFPLAVLGPRRILQLLTTGRVPGRADQVALIVPVAGAVATQLWPYRRELDPAVASVMVGTAVVNAVGEEVLWRGVFLEELPDDALRGAVWPLMGFALWHLAPQLILSSRLGRMRFVLGSAVVGAAATVTARRGEGLRWAVASHLLTDACGVTAARFRLGREASR